MFKVVFVLAGLLFSANVFADSACGCSGKKEKTQVLKEVKTRESSIITSTDGTPLKAWFPGTAEVAKTTATAQKAPASTATPKTTTAPIAAPVVAPTAYKLAFDTNAVTPTAASQQQLNALKKALASGTYKEVKIVGFADETGTTAYNQKLSLARAQEIGRMVKDSAPNNASLKTIGGGVRQATNLEKARIVEVQIVR